MSAARPLLLRYVGHRPGASLAYFTGASVDLAPGSEFELPDAGLVLGRASDADVRIASSQVARAHAHVSPTDGGITVEDLGSTNGTLVNGERIERAVLHAGDRLSLAGYFDFEVVERSRAGR